ncbi:MAG: YraN family protein [Clostridiales bacterium]|nr:YraN family protein [Clostridiales bacterium]
MKNKREIGTEAENKAAIWIEKNKAYEILERNYCRRTGEIDIIAKDGETLVFIEVKYRRDASCGYPAEAVTRNKQRHIMDTALMYIQEKGGSFGRFDVAEIMEKNGEAYIRYTENAFEWRTD